MVFANSAGRKVAEDMWPDIEWSTDNKISLPLRRMAVYAHTGHTITAAFGGSGAFSIRSAESLGFAVASALHRRAWPLRVAWWSGDGTDIMVHTWGDRPADEGGDLALYADYVPPGRHRLDAC